MQMLIALTLLAQSTIGQTPTQTSGLEAREFERLHARLQPPAEDGWSSIEWKTSLAQACVQAARKKKPLFMVVRSGHPLGCV